MHVFQVDVKVNSNPWGSRIYIGAEDLDHAAEIARRNGYDVASMCDLGYLIGDDATAKGSTT